MRVQVGVWLGGLRKLGENVNRASRDRKQHSAYSAISRPGQELTLLLRARRRGGRLLLRPCRPITRRSARRRDRVAINSTPGTPGEPAEKRVDTSQAVVAGAAFAAAEVVCEFEVSARRARQRGAKAHVDLGKEVFDPRVLGVMLLVAWKVLLHVLLMQGLGGEPGVCQRRSAPREPAELTKTCAVGTEGAKAESCIICACGVCVGELGP